MHRKIANLTEARFPHHKKIYGSVSMNIPAPYAIVIFGFSVLLGALLIYIFSTNFTAMYVVKGYLNAKLGIARVYPLHAGVIKRCFVTSGQTVQKGDALFLIDTMDEISSTDEQILLQNRLMNIERRLHAKTHYLHMLKPLLAKHYLSLAGYQILRDQVTTLEARQYALKRTLLRYQRLRAYIVRSPITGLIANLEFQVGQKVDVTQALLTVLPHDATLVAQLYVPAAKAGFLQEGAKIALHYDAYPYQHFGVAQARIMTVSRSIMSDREEEKPLIIGEPYYKVIANLEQQFIVSSGQQHVLQQGMTCTAVLTGMHKKLWRWIFDPIQNAMTG